MRINRISFIEPKSPGRNIFSKLLIPRLGAPLLATILQRRDYIVRVYIEEIAPIDWNFVSSSDIVCISTITSTAPLAYKIAEMAKEKGKIVVMGGAHPSFLPGEALKYCDFVVRGEGDKTLPELIDCLEKGEGLKNSLGLSYKKSDGSIAHNENRPLLSNEELNILPEPDLSLIHKWERMKIYPVSTSRGCPFNCRFCSVIPMFGRKYRFRSPEKVIQELKYVKSVCDKKFFFVDDNFAANKERTKEILRRIIREKIDITWSAQVRADIANDPELLDLIPKSGGGTLQIGFESINPETLKLYNKKQNLEEIEICIKMLKKRGIDIHGMFVLGEDTDVIETAGMTADFAIKSEIDFIQFLVLTPLPGTPVYEEMEKDGRLIHKQWNKYDGHHVVFKPNGMTAAELHLGTLKAMGRFYSNRYIAKHFFNLLKHAMKFNPRFLKDDFICIMAGRYGKSAVREALEEAPAYLRMLDDYRKKCETC